MSKQLAVIVRNSGLEMAEGKTLLEKFGNYEQIAKEWEIKAKQIVVTDASQTTEMAMAKTARKKFSELRIEVEKSRKEMKEQSLRKGQAIDAIARFLVSLISPIEEHLKLQEDFVKIQEAKKAEELRIEAEKKAAEELRLKMEAEEKERERIRLENIRLQEEARKREEEFARERAKAEAKRRQAEEKARKEREEVERLAMIEREKAEKKLAEERAKAEAKRMLAEEKARKEKEEAERLAKIEREKVEKKLAEERAKAEQERQKAEAERLEKERMQKLLDAQIECPYCHKKFTKYDGGYMREIKFRAWDKNSEVMVLDPMIDGYLNDEILNLQKISNYKFMQFTGLKDKNGKEIYEGDIVDCGGGLIEEVKWGESVAVFLPFGNHDASEYAPSCQVIGNIYENEELLK